MFDTQSFSNFTYRAAVLYLLFPCIPGKDKTGDPSPGDKELSERLRGKTKEHIKDVKICCIITFTGVFIKQAYELLSWLHMISNIEFD